MSSPAAWTARRFGSRPATPFGLVFELPGADDPAAEETLAALRSRLAATGPIRAAIVRELRRQHHLIASPYGTSVAVGAMSSIVALYPVLSLLDEDDAVAVPLREWAETTADRHADLRRQTRGGHLARRPRNESLLEIDRIAANLRSTDAWNERVGDVIESKVGIADLLDAAARATERRLEGGDGPADPITEMIAHLANAGEVSPALVNALVFYALSGTTGRSPEDAAASPLDRFELLVSQVMLEDAPPVGDDIPAFLDAFAAEEGWPTLTEELARSLAYAENFATSLKKRCDMLAERLGAPLHPKSLLDAVDAFVASKRSIVAAILADPMGYFDPERWAEALEDLPSLPVFGSSLGDDYRRGSKLLKAAEAAGWAPLIEEVAADGSVIPHFLGAPFQTPGRPILSPAGALELAVALWIAELLARRDDVDPLHRELAAHAFRQVKPKIELILIG